jgi:hypothetical protein
VGLRRPHTVLTNRTQPRERRGNGRRRCLECDSRIWDTPRDGVAGYVSRLDLCCATRVTALFLIAEVKKEEMARYKQSKEDPDFQKSLEERGLGPEQSESRDRIHRQVEVDYVVGLSQWNISHLLCRLSVDA